MYVTSFRLLSRADGREYLQASKWQSCDNLPVFEPCVLQGHAVYPIFAIATNDLRFCLVRVHNISMYVRKQHVKNEMPYLHDARRDVYCVQKLSREISRADVPPLSC